MELHQISVTYDSVADRLLMRVRSRDGEQFAGWFTRRLMVRLWPVLHRMADCVAAAASMPGASLRPETQSMLAGIRRIEALRRSDLSTPFDVQATRHPLGEDPLLLTEVQLQLQPSGQLAIAFQGADGRTFDLQLGEDLAQAWLHLTEKALVAADWCVFDVEHAPPSLPSARRPQLLN